MGWDWFPMKVKSMFDSSTLQQKMFCLSFPWKYIVGKHSIFELRKQSLLKHKNDFTNNDFQPTKQFKLHLYNGDDWKNIIMINKC